MPSSGPVSHVLIPLAVIAVLFGVGSQLSGQLLRPQYTFRDMDPSTIEGQAAQYLYERGIVSGFADGNFGPRMSINRAQAAKILLIAGEKPLFNMRNVGIFNDVPDDQWYTQYVLSAAMHEIISGYIDRSFRPNNPINTAEYLKMLAITFNLPPHMPHTYTDVFPVDWFNRYAGAAQTYNLFPLRPESRLQPSKWITRQEAAIAVYQILRSQPQGTPFPVQSSSAAAVSSAQTWIPSAVSSAASSEDSPVINLPSSRRSSSSDNGPVLQAGSSKKSSSAGACYFPPAPPAGCLYECERNVSCLRQDQCQLRCGSASSRR